MKNEQARWAAENVKKLDDGSLSRAGRILLGPAKAENYLGSGIERDVFAMDDGRAIAYFVRPRVAAEQIEKEVKSYFYGGKLAHLLAPDCFPDVHLAASRPMAVVSDRIYPTGKQPDTHARYGFRRRMERLGLERAVDLASGNLLQTDDGRLAYVDIVTPELLVSNEELESHISTLDPQVRARVRRLQLRLLENLPD